MRNQITVVIIRVLSEPPSHINCVLGYRELGVQHEQCENKTFWPKEGVTRGGGGVSLETRDQLHDQAAFIPRGIDC
jgi:hypothetical protein